MIYKTSVFWEVIFEYEKDNEYPNHEDGEVTNYYVALDLSDILVYLSKRYEGLKIISAKALYEDIEVVTVHEEDSI